MGWISDRLPTSADADLHGSVRWGPRHPGLLCPWQDVRPGEPWRHSSAWSGAGGDAHPLAEGGLIGDQLRGGGGLETAEQHLGIGGD